MMRDYLAWHRAYDDPSSDLSWRLEHVQRFIEAALDRHSGELGVLSVCSGDGRDVLEVLAGRAEADRCAVTLIEIHPEIAQQARDAAARSGLRHVEVRTADAGLTDAYTGAVPADVVVLVGIFGNIDDADLERTINTAPQLCRPGATLIWSRGRDRDDHNNAIRTWFAEAGFSELDYLARDTGTRPALGVVRFDGTPPPLVVGRRLFTFWR